MEKIDVLFKTSISFVGAIISWMVGGLGLALAVLLGLMFIDFATGMMAGSKVEGLKSSTGKNGLKKKVSIILLISAVYLMQTLIPELAAVGYAADGVTIAYAVLEFVSIFENVGRLGVPLGPIKKIIAVLKDKDQEARDDAA